jgi:signal transduction histidine kinase
MYDYNYASCKETAIMQLQGEKAQEQIIEELQQQVDDLKAQNHLLQDQLKQKEQSMAMIAHDLRGPLSPIINYAQLISRYARQPKDETKNTAQNFLKKQAAIQRNTSIIVSQAQRLSRLVEDLLDSTHLDSGKFNIIREDCNIVQLTKEMVVQLRPVAPYHKLVTSVPRQAIIGQWDGGRLQQALGNLLDNAIKYSDENTTITVSVVKLEQSVRVSVHNEGASIPSAEVSQLFHPYVRLSGASSRHGSGLGLFITKSIIEAHQGKLNLEPHTEDQYTGGRGTTFSFELPLLEQ